MKIKHFLPIVLSLIPFFSFSKSDWSSTPFDQKVFIENNGQFNPAIGSESSKIYFGAQSNGLELYFYANGLTYKHQEFAISSAPIAENKIIRASNNAGADENEENPQSISEYLSMQWLGSSPNVKVVGEESVSFYYTYGSRVKVRACKKIIYQNLYPNIDVEYVFPADKGGIKYSIIMHSGANPADIKMKWSGGEPSLKADGNIHINSPFGEFVDHAPVSYDEDGTKIESSFQLESNIVSFAIIGLKTSYFKHQTITIDPWTTSPIGTFTMNKGYDVNYDNYGNVYVYGSWSPSFQLAKFNSAGALQWIYNTALNGYGDFTVDKTTGTCYVTEGWRCNNCDPALLRISSLGTLIKNTTLKNSANDVLWELWRIEFNECDHTLLLMGGTLASGFGRQAAVIDTNLNILTYAQPVVSTNMGVDIAMGAIDKYNCCQTAYVLSERSNTMGGNNMLAKFPLPGVMPPVWNVNTDHKFYEGCSVWYAGPTPVYNILVGWAMGTHGFNGIAISPNYVYTYDSDSLKRWNKTTGALVAAIDVSSAAPLFAPSGPQQGLAIWCKWGGLDVDECDNIYVGVAKDIKVYDATFNLINTYNLPDSVFDLRFGAGNKLYACGKGYVLQIDNVISHGTTVNISQTPATACNLCNGSATVNTVTACGSAPAISYSWQGGQTTQTATGLCSGAHSVTVSVNCVNTTYTFTVGGAPALLATTIASASKCGGNNGSATVNTSGGTAPYTYSWSNGATTQTASSLSSGLYNVTITDSQGCTKTASAFVLSVPLILNVPRDYYICAEGGGTVQLTASGGMFYTWSPGATLSDSTIANPLASPFVTTTYTVTVSNGSCSDTAHVTIHLVSPPGPPHISLNGDTLSVSPGFANYQWYFNGSPIAAATDSFYVAIQDGTYNVYVTDTLGCSRLGDGILYVAVQLIAESQIEIYPNPAGNQFTVSGLPLSVDTKLELFNVLGETVNYLKPEAGKNEGTVFDVSTLSNGIYFLMIHVTNGSEQVINKKGAGIALIMFSQ